MENPNQELNFEELNIRIRKMYAVFNASDFYDFFAIRKLIFYEKIIVDKRGKNKNMLETNILKTIKMFYDDIRDGFISEYKFENPELNEMLIINTEDDDLAEFHLTSFEIYYLVKFLLAVKNTNDNFSSKRKVFAIELMFSLLLVYNIKEIDEILIDILIKGKYNLISYVMNALTEFLKIKNGEYELSKKIVDLIYKKIKTVRDRHLLLSYLNVLFNANIITDTEASYMLMDWKERNNDIY